MDLKKIKIYLSLTAIFLLVGSITVNMGNKLNQQNMVFLRGELQQLETRILDKGVSLCVIQAPQTRNWTYNPDNVLCILKFSSNDKKAIQDNLPSVKELIEEYCRKKGGYFKSVKYLDEDGFNLDNILSGKIELNIDENDIEYSSIHEYILSQEYRLLDEFQKIIPLDRIRIKILASVEYDAPQNRYDVKKQIFYAQFKDLTQEQLLELKIIYKRVSGFKKERGDKIYFKKLSAGEFNNTARLSFYTLKELEKGDITQPIQFNPINKTK